MEGDPLSTSWETFYLISATFLFKKKKEKKIEALLLSEKQPWYYHD